MTITKLGHCCLIVSVNGVRFLTDPGSYTTEQNTANDIDCIVVSHEHTDHLHVESLKMVIANNPSAEIITNKAVGKILEKEGIRYTTVSDGQSHKVKGVTISGHGMSHAPIYNDYELVENTGYLFDNMFYYPGDAFHKPDVPVDILAVPVTGPWCKISEALDYAILVSPKVAFPVHDGNLKRAIGVTKRLPELTLPKHGINFIYLELGKETTFS